MKDTIEDSALTRKERERLFRREEIMTAAAKLFAEKGFNAATLDDIAELSEFGKGTLYNYFSGKEEIYTAIIEDVIENHKSIIIEASDNSNSFTDFVEKYTDMFFNYCLQNSNSFVIFVREIVNLNTSICIDPKTFRAKYAEINDVFAKQIAKGFKEKKLKKIDPEKLIVLYNHMVLPYIHHLICKKFDSDIKAEADFIRTVLFEGILIK